MNVTHTPTPWSVGTRTHDNCPTIAAHGLVVAMLMTGTEFQEEADANAAFIVKAVNSHLWFVWALREMRDRLLRGEDIPLFLVEAALKEAGEPV